MIPITFEPVSLVMQMRDPATGRHFQRVEPCEAFAGLAVHLSGHIKAADGKPIYAISHLPSGRRAARMFFDTPEAARAAAVAMAALPIDWQAAIPNAPQGLGPAVDAVCHLCGGFLVEHSFQTVAGHA